MIKYAEFLPNYVISSDGKVFNSKKQKELKLRNKKKGYKECFVYDSGELKAFYVHRLVAKAFIPNPDNKPQVDHIDGNPSNNDVSNLRWCTNKENANFPIARKNKSEAKKGKYKGEKCYLYGKLRGEHPRSRPILQFSKDGEFIREWDCIRSASYELKIDGSAISKCCRGKLIQTNGYKWKYKDI